MKKMLNKKEIFTKVTDNKSLNVILANNHIPLLHGIGCYRVAWVKRKILAK